MSGPRLARLPWPSAWLEWASNNLTFGIWLRDLADEGSAHVGDAWCFVWPDGRDMPHGPILRMTWTTDDQGAITEAGIRYVAFDDAFDDPPSVSHEALVIAYVTAVTRFTLAFAACRNVALEEALPSRQQRRAAARRGETLRSHHVLVIDPSAMQRQRGGSAATTGALHAKRLHIARGHFAEYGPAYGKGLLFGRLEGRYWVPAHARGSGDEVAKTYKVLAPRT